MAVTVSSFIQSFPEFAGAATKLPLQQFLDNATAFTPVGLWGSLTDQGIQLRAAQTLALSPFGRGMAFGANKDGSTNYDARLKELTNIVGVAAMVTG